MTAVEIEFWVIVIGIPLLFIASYIFVRWARARKPSAIEQWRTAQQWKAIEKINPEFKKIRDAPPSRIARIRNHKAYLPTLIVLLAVGYLWSIAFP